MMRKTISRPAAPVSNPYSTQANPDVPSIRLIAATPSASGLSSSEANTSMNTTLNSSWASVPSVPSPLAPKNDDPAPRKRLVPKKSKLGLLGVGGNNKEKEKEKERGKDFSDVVRRVGASSSSRRGFDIYVDPTDDPEIGEILMVKKKKSRAGLDGMRWGSGAGALEEVTNVPSVTPPAVTMLKPKAEEKDKWWSIGRGRKDSKEKEKQKEKENKARDKSKSRPEAPRSKTPEPFKSIPDVQSRARFNSLDSGVVLNSPTFVAEPVYASRNTSTPQLLNVNVNTIVSDDNRPPPINTSASRSATPTLGGFLAPPSSAGTEASTNQGSIAIRAMRSVRSLARIGSWAQLKNGAPGDEAMPVDKKEEKEKKSKDKDEKKSKVKSEKKFKDKDGEKKTKKEKEKDKDKEKKGRAQTVRGSTSSFEAGALSTSPEVAQTMRKKKSILGLGLPSTMRLPTVRSGSTTSSIGISSPVEGNVDNNRLSVESAILMAGRARSGSCVSTGSSLRPMSTTSSVSRTSSSSSASIRWDEEGLETVKEQRRRERESRRISEEQEEKDTKRKRKTERDSRRASGEGRRRTPLTEVFPDIQSSSPRSSTGSFKSTDPPLLTLEEATSDGHERVTDSTVSTPVRKARPRPISEQLLGKSRPHAIHDEDGEGVLSILDAATNDLAQLINNLDLEATPGNTPASPNMSPWRQQILAGLTPHLADASSPTKRTLRKDISSITSLRPYAQSRDTAKLNVLQDRLGQQIAPWPVLNSMFPKDSPKASPASSPRVSVVPKTRPNHKRTLSPPGPMLENSPPMIKPLRPARSRSAVIPMKPLGPPPSESLPSIEAKKDEFGTVRVPSSLTFGSRSSSRGGDSSISSMDDIKNRPPVPVLPSAFGQGHVRNKSSLLSSQLNNDSSEDENTTSSRPLAPGARRMLGMKGTMGGSDVSAYAVDELDASDPDSDIPDELQNILAKQYEDDTLSYRPKAMSRSASPVDVPHEVRGEEHSDNEPEPLDIPMFHLTDADDNHIDIDDMQSDGELDTKSSFDFTGEIQKLNESGGSDRRSFVEQLENAFRTPAKLDLRYDFGPSNNGMLSVEVPPLPPLPPLPKAAADTSSSTIQTDMSNMSHSAPSGSSSQTSEMDSFPVSRLLDVKEPTLLPGSDSLGSNSDTDDLMLVDDSDSAEPSLESVHIVPASRPSDGQLNKAFKFGGMSKVSSSPEATEIKKKESQPMTLSDIIPPPSHVRSVSNASSVSVGESVINSIIAQAAEMPSVRPRPRVNSDSSAQMPNVFTSLSSASGSSSTGGMQIQYRHSRHESGLSFTGFDSFDEVRRGFEFHDYRPAFYPPPVSNNRRSAHNRQESTFSFASISSYGHVLNPGVPDPFDYGLPSLRERPSSEDMTTSMSMSQSIDDTFSFIHRAPRRRVESDASSFYFDPQPQSQSFIRGHGRNESNMSVVSGPPVSLYNRSFAAHRRNDSSSSVSSMAHSYAMHGASGGRAAWARHRQDASVDSTNSGFSFAMRIGRPGLGDKMFETAGVPLTSISASPTDSAIDIDIESRISDSRMGRTMMTMTENPSSFDSIMDTDQDQRTSIEIEDSLFDKTGNRSSVSSESVFGYDFSRFPEGGLVPPGNFRPISSFSISSVHSPAQEDDTMISMIGGGHVRRRSVGSAIEASPCVRFGQKRKQPPQESVQPLKGMQDPGHATKARIIEKPSIASTSSSMFGGERMIKARRGLLERQSLEESVLMAEGEDLSISFSSAPVFTRPGPASRSRSSTCTSVSLSSGTDTPPLSPSDGSMSMSDGSQSSIDLSQLSTILANATHPVSNINRNRLRARARGHGHRRRISQARMSRSSVYETIEEEMSSNASSPNPQSKKSSPTAIQSVYVVDADTASIHSSESFWDDERGIVALRKYYDLRDEAESAVSESKRVWIDTPFSLYALQTFNPPRQPSAMQALLDDSVQNYRSLPCELRPRRRRVQSRPSPYPQGRTSKISLTSDSPRPAIEASMRTAKTSHGSPLQQISINPNIGPATNKPKFEATKPFATLEDDLENVPLKTRENAFGLANGPRPRVGSSARRTALGWSKRSTGKASSDLKENVAQGVSMTPGESLRLSRPRPRGRPTPARAIRA